MVTYKRKKSLSTEAEERTEAEPERNAAAQVPEADGAEQVPVSAPTTKDSAES